LFLSLALGGWWIVSTPFALHIPTALNGEYDYYNGLWTHLSCLALFVASMSIPSDMATARRIAALLATAVVAVAMVNISETTGFTTIGLNEVSTLGDRVAASALMNFAIPFAAVALVRVRHWALKAGLGVALALLLISEFLSQGRGAWIGLVVATIILIVGLARSKGRWKIIAVFLAGIVLLAGLAAKLNPMVAQRFATLSHISQDESINQRFIYYRAALRAVKEHPVAGIGFENFRNAYPQYWGADDIYFFNNVIPTMVHNGYLEAALNNGIPALVLYLALVAVVLVKLGRELSKEASGDRRDLLLCILATLAAYLVQDLTGWLDLALAPAFWIMLGLAMNQAEQPVPGTSTPATKHAITAFSGLMIVLSLYLLTDAYARVITDSRLFRAQSLDVRTQWRDAESLVKEALSSLPADSRTELVAGQIYASRFMATHDRETYARSRELLESSYDHNRFDRMRLVNIAALEVAALELGQIGAASEFARKALTVLAKTDGDNPAFHEFRAKFFVAQGDFYEALKAIREARRLAPQEDRLRLIESEYRQKFDSQKASVR